MKQIYNTIYAPNKDKSVQQWSVYVDGNIVSYQYESVSRNQSDEKLKRLNDDYKDRLYPFVKNNINKLSKYILNDGK